MSRYLEDPRDHLEQELAPEPLMAPATGSVVLHLSLAAGIVLYGFIGGLFHHNLWGGAGASGAIQVNLVSSALPLPSTQPVNQNVLSTETPSPAPAPPQPKAKQEQDETAIPIEGKQKKPEHQTAQKTPPKQQEQVENNRANYGEQQGSNIARSNQQQAFTSGQTSVTDASFGSLFGWYVGQIDRTMNSNGYRSMADPRTPKGAKVTITFKINRDGSHGDVELNQSSGSPSWDSVCVRAAQRVDTFGPLPAQYRGSYLQVFYDCTY
jgi:periplasmic protein TonB